MINEGNMKFDIPKVVNDLEDIKFVKLPKKYKREIVISAFNRAYLRTRCAEAQNWRCCYCGVHMNLISNDHKSATLEHIVPTSKGGDDTYNNCVAACFKCNTKRGNADFDENYNLIMVQYTKRDPNAHLERKLRRAKKLIENGGDFNAWYKTTRMKSSFKKRFIELMNKE